MVLHDHQPLLEGFGLISPVRAHVRHLIPSARSINADLDPADSRMKDGL
jgi:hypothetical protein